MQKITLVAYLFQGMLISLAVVACFKTASIDQLPDFVVSIFSTLLEYVI